MNRRDFLKGAAGLGAAAIAGGCATGGRVVNGFDENLTVFISDLHVSGTLAKYDYTRRRLEKTVADILAMRPLPKRVVCFGDVAITYGRPEDYRASKPILMRLVDASIELTLTLGNHDRRAAFLEAWPEYRTRTQVPGRVTSVVSLGDADLVLLDALKGADDRPLDDMGPVEGTIDPAQLAWLETWIANAKRPFFVGSHQFRDLYVDGQNPIGRLAKSPHAVGWIYGHDHTWCPDMQVASWADHAILPTLALPSTGLWGDIGYVLFRTSPDGALAELVQDDFYFQTPTAHAVRPRYWDVRLSENQGKTMRFAFERN